LVLVVVLDQSYFFWYRFKYLMIKDDKIIKKDGIITECLPNGFFRIETEDGTEVLGHLSGKLRIHRIRILLGDKVTIEMTPYDDKRGRITYRKK